MFDFIKKQHEKSKAAVELANAFKLIIQNLNKLTSPLTGDETATLLFLYFYYNQIFVEKANQFDFDVALKLHITDIGEENSWLTLAYLSTKVHSKIYQLKEENSLHSKFLNIDEKRNLYFELEEYYVKNRDHLGLWY